jgi:coenzyme F420-reducing hydrogenase gamma subunit
VLRSLNNHPKPAETVIANHLAVVEEALCLGCETCLERCQMRAITITDDAAVEDGRADAPYGPEKGSVVGFLRLKCVSSLDRARCSHL